METQTVNCVCGKCDGPYIDPEDWDYLETHFECDSCGSDFPIDKVKITELNRTVFHECEDCNEK